MSSQKFPVVNLSHPAMGQSRWYVNEMDRPKWYVNEMDRRSEPLSKWYIRELDSRNVAPGFTREQPIGFESAQGLECPEGQYRPPGSGWCVPKPMAPVASVDRRIPTMPFGSMFSGEQGVSAASFT
jgi:hypothetical protein